MTNPATSEFREALAKIVRKAVEEYVATSGMGSWDTPESWIQSAIAHGLSRDYYVMLEVRTRDLETWHEVRRRTTPDEEPPTTRNGRVDLVLFDRSSSDPSEAETVALIEIKKYAKRFDCRDDVNRLRGLANDIGLQHGGFVVAYLQQTTEKALQASIQDLLRDEIGTANSAAIEPFSGAPPGIQCAAVVAEVQPQYDEMELKKLEILREAVAAGVSSGLAEDFSFASINAKLDQAAQRIKSGGETL